MEETKKPANYTEITEPLFIVLETNKMRTSEEEAMKDAEILALKNPGKKIHVFRVTGTFVEVTKNK